MEVLYDPACVLTWTTMTHGDSELNTLGPWPWDGLNAFFATARTGSLSAAASLLGISQPTVGRRIDALEAALGGRVLERDPAGCRPTRLGHAILPQLEQVRLQGQSLRSAVQRQRNVLGGVVRIATGPMIGQHLARHLGALVHDDEDLELEIVPSMDFEALERGGADIAIRSRAPDTPGALCRRLGVSPFGVFANPEWARSRGVDLDRLPDARHRWVGPLSTSQAPSARWLRAHLGRDADLRLGSSLAVLEAAAAGAGFGVLPAFAGDAHPALARGGCFDSWLVRPAATADVTRVRVLADRLAAVLPSVQRPR
jgi:DNA-binding transcriptional LysR family regulator